MRRTPEKPSWKSLAGARPDKPDMLSLKIQIPRERSEGGSRSRSRDDDDDRQPDRSDRRRDDDKKDDRPRHNTEG